MPRTSDELLSDIAELKALLLVKDAALATKDAELIAAKNGLIHSQLTIEMLKAQLAKLRREKFGSSSERIEQRHPPLWRAIRASRAEAKEAAHAAKEALDKIGVLFDIERPIAGAPPDHRKSVRQRLAKPRIEPTWFDDQLQKIPGKSNLAGAIRYARSRWDALTRYLDDGRLEISNNAAENQIRPLALGRKTGCSAAPTPAATEPPCFTR